MFKELSPEEAEKLLKEDPNSLVLDVRTPIEWDNFHLEDFNVRLIPVQELQDRFNELQDKNQLIVVTCRAGVRGAAASEFLSNNGFTNIVNVQGGLLSWNTYRANSKQISEEEHQRVMQILMAH